MARERIFTKEELFQTSKNILLNHGYDGFTFSLLAKQLDSSRATLYKYFKNKEELISYFMLYEMDQVLSELRKFENYEQFDEQFDYLLHVIYKNSKIRKIIKMTYLIPTTTNEKVQTNLERLEALHKEMYVHLQSFIDLGRRERRFKSTIPDSLILGVIFQTVDIPNHYDIPQDEWITSIKEIISHGMFT